MTRVIRISQQNWTRLQTYADQQHRSQDQMVNNALDQAERQQEHQTRSQNPPPEKSDENNRR